MTSHNYITTLIVYKIIWYYNNIGVQLTGLQLNLG